MYKELCKTEIVENYVFDYLHTTVWNSFYIYVLLLSEGNWTWSNGDFALLYSSLCSVPNKSQILLPAVKYFT